MFASKKGNLTNKQNYILKKNCQYPFESTQDFRNIVIQPDK